VKSGHVFVEMPLRAGRHAIPLGDDRALQLTVPDEGSRITARVAFDEGSSIGVSTAELTFERPLTLENAGRSLGLRGPVGGLVDLAAKSARVHRIELTEHAVLFDGNVLGIPLGMIPFVGQMLRRRLEKDLLTLTGAQPGHVQLPSIPGDVDSLFKSVGGLVESASVGCDLTLHGTHVELKDGGLRLSRKGAGDDEMHLSVLGDFRLASTDWHGSLTGSVTAAGAPMRVSVETDASEARLRFQDGLDVHFGGPHGTWLSLGKSALQLVSQAGQWAATAWGGPLTLDAPVRGTAELPSADFSGSFHLHPAKHGGLSVGSSTAQVELRDGAQLSTDGPTRVALALGEGANLTARASGVNTTGGLIDVLGPEFEVNVPISTLGIRNRDLPGLIRGGRIEGVGTVVSFDPATGTFRVGKTKVDATANISGVGPLSLDVNVTSNDQAVTAQGSAQTPLGHIPLTIRLRAPRTGESEPVRRS
jgi:hypothetical protein